MRLDWPLPAGDIGVEIASNDGSHDDNSHCRCELKSCACAEISAACVALERNGREATRPPNSASCAAAVPPRKLRGNSMGMGFTPASRYGRTSESGCAGA